MFKKDLIEQLKNKASEFNIKLIDIKSITIDYLDSDLLKISNHINRKSVIISSIKYLKVDDLIKFQEKN